MPRPARVSLPLHDDRPPADMQSISWSDDAELLGLFEHDPAGRLRGVESPARFVQAWNHLHTTSTRRIETLLERSDPAAADGVARRDRQLLPRNLRTWFL